MILFFVFCSIFSLLVSGQQEEEQFPQAAWHSFQPPYGVQFWSLSGHAVTMNDRIRLTDEKDQGAQGQLWNILANTNKYFEAEVQFKIGSAAATGADGLAFWYTSATGLSGNFFGSSPSFSGIGVLIDSYDNAGDGKHPYVSLVYSKTGSEQFSHDQLHRGEGQGHSEGGAGDGQMELGGCTAQVRNVGQSTLRIAYRPGGDLVVYVRPHYKAEEVECVRAAGIDLPEGWYFGFTAATGDLADNHDVLGFTVRRIGDQGELLPDTLPPEALAQTIHHLRHEGTVVREQLFALSSRVLDIFEAVDQLRTAGLGMGGGGGDVGGGYDPSTDPSSHLLSSVAGDVSSLAQQVSQIDTRTQQFVQTAQHLESNVADLQRRLTQLQTTVEQSATTAAAAAAAAAGSSSSSTSSWITTVCVVVMFCITVFQQISKSMTRKSKSF